MKKLIAYKTGIEHTDCIVEEFSNSINRHIKNYSSSIIHINDFLKNGIPNEADGVITFGILRGSGHLLKQAATMDIDRYFIDHAYFDAGYHGDWWVRISKNKHTMNYVREVSDFRWKNFFSQKHPIMPWKTSQERGGNILIIPPTSAICWYFNENEWQDNILNYLENNLSKESFNKVKIRGKPKEPIVDKNGKYLGLKVNEDVQNNPLEDDLNNSSIVIAYNSQVALDASLRGLPVIVNQHNSCNTLSFKLSDLKSGINNPIFDQEPERKKLFKWLTYCQFKFSEIKSGFAWKTISNFQI